MNTLEKTQILPLRLTEDGTIRVGVQVVGNSGVDVCQCYRGGSLDDLFGGGS